MGFTKRATVMMSGVLTAGVVATLTAALPAGAATYGTEQSGGGNVFGVGAHSAIIGVSKHAPNVSFTRSVRGHTVEFSYGHNQCVTDTPGGLSLQTCHGSAAQKFTEVGTGGTVALENQATHEFVQDNGLSHRVTTVRVRPDRFGHLRFGGGQEWKWITVSNNQRHPGGPVQPPRHH